MGPGGGHRSRDQPSGDPRPGQADLGDGQRLPNRPGQRRRHPVSRPDQPPHKPPQLRHPQLGHPQLWYPPPTIQPGPPRFGPPEGERSRGRGGVLPAVHNPPRRWLWSLEPAGVIWRPLGPDQGGQEPDQALAVEGGVVAGDRHAGPARPGHQPDRRLGGQVETGHQLGGFERVAVDGHQLRRRAGMPGLPVQARPGHGDRPVQGGQPLLEPLDGLGQGRGDDHGPGGPPVGEAQQGQRIGRSRRRQARPAGYRPPPGTPGRIPGSPARTPGPRRWPTNNTVGEQTATRRASASSGRHQRRRLQVLANPSGCSE